MIELTVKDKIAQIQRYMFLTIPAMIKETPDMSFQEYLLNCRLPLNFQIIPTLVGADLILNKKNPNANDLDFNYNIPTKVEFQTLTAWNNGFLDNIESPFIDRLEDKEVISSFDDMTVLRKNIETLKYKGSNVLKLKDVTTTKIKNYLYGYAGYPPLSLEILTNEDLVHIINYGKVLKDHHESVGRVAAVAGFVGGLGAGLAVGYAISKHKKKKRMMNSVPALPAPIEEPSSNTEEVPNVVFE